MMAPQATDHREDGFRRLIREFDHPSAEFSPMPFWFWNDTLTEEEIMCIRYHMGAFTDKEEWRDYTNAVKNFPNVLWTHQADMLASHVSGV